MSTRNKVIICVSVVALAFASGRYLTPTKIKVETRIVEVEKKTTEQSKDTKKSEKKTVTKRTTRKPNGEVIKETIVSKGNEEESKTKSKDSSESSKDSSSSKEQTVTSDKVTISMLGGVNLNDFLPFYGAAVTKPVLGPITLGIFGTSNGNLGGSVGITF